MLASMEIPYDSAGRQGSSSDLAFLSIGIVFLAERFFGLSRYV